MINVSKAFRWELYENRRNYLAYADITLVSGSVLHLTNEHILLGGFSKEDAVSDDNSFSALGSVVIGSASLTINNMDESFSAYDFTNAAVVIYVGLMVPYNNTTQLEKLRLGTYTVDSAAYNGSGIILSLLDYMERFDRPYSGSTLRYPASLDTIVRGACTDCGVTLYTTNFPQKNFVVSARPTDDAVTYRDVISWAAAIAGCFAKCDVYGRLEIKWFDQAALENRNTGYDGGIFDSSTPYSTGDALNGGTFRPWNSGSSADGGLFTDDIPLHHIYGLYSQDIGVDDVVITGVRIMVDNPESDGASTLQYTSGSSGYMVEVTGNGFITPDNAQAIAGRLGTQLIGLTFRKASVTHASDPSIEAGDVGVVWDRKGRDYPILITRVSFGIGSSQTIVCGAETPGRNSATRYSGQTKAYVEARKLLQKEVNNWEAAEEDLAERIANANGLYQTDVTSSSGTIHYLHNKVLLNDSDIRIMISDVGVTMTANGTAETPTWYGLTVDGTLIANILNVIGINADWINTGQLVVRSPSYDSILNTTSGMSLIVDGKKDDVTTTLTGVDWFVFEGKTATSVYVNSNSWFQFGGSTPSSSGSTSSGELNISRRDGALYKLYRQVGVFNGVNFMKIRYEGYTFYSSTEYRYKLTYELFLWPDGSLLLNIIDIPSSSNDRGVSSVVTPSKTTTLTDAITMAGLYRLYGDDSHTWHVNAMGSGGSEVMFVDCDTGIVRIAADLKLGGTNNVNGSMKIYDAGDTLIGVWDKDGVQINKGSLNIGNGNFTVNSSGVLSATGASVSGVLTAGSGSTVGGLHVSATGIYSGTYGGYDDYSYDRRGFFLGNDGSISITSNLSNLRMKDGDFRLYVRSDDYDAQSYNTFELDTDGIVLETIENNYRTKFTNFTTGGVGFNSVGGTPWASYNISGLTITFDTGGYFMVSKYYMQLVGNVVSLYNFSTGELSLGGSFSAKGTKSRIATTEDYGERLLYCYETPTPMFGDIGEGVIGEDGRCFIPIDPTFAETISNTQYQVFLQKYGNGECYVSERKPSYFIVEGTSDLSFGWELKAKQRDYEQRRLDTPITFSSSGIREDIGNDGVSHVTESTVDYGEAALNHIKEINNERVVTG